MHIKKLEICGFKSFVDRTVIHFDHDIIGVVGPNGCGKSNVVDAIRWVMGEQSAKALRGKGMGDVIFNGSESRQAAGFAEVTLTFDNADPEGAQALPLEFREFADISVTRRIYRGDGSNDYFINKTPVRLRDVSELFLGTGVGRQAYSIVEQGKIGLIVSARAEDRRSLIEEAAGITKYKARKRQAENKMNLTRVNLTRVSDIVSEIERQLGSLKRQAQKATRYMRYREELDDLSLWEASHKLLELITTTRVAQDARTENEERVRVERASVDARDAEIEVMRNEAQEAERTAERAQNDAFMSDNDVRENDTRIERSTDRFEVIDTRLAQARNEQTQLERKASEVADERASIEEQLLVIAQDQSREQELVGEEESKLLALIEANEDAVANVTTLRQQDADAVAAMARAEAALEGFQQRRSEMLERTQRLSLELARLEGEHAGLSVKRQELNTRVSELVNRKHAMCDARDALGVELPALETLFSDQEKALEDQRTELHTRRSRLKALQEIAERMEGLGAGVRNLLATGDASLGGLLADRIDVPAEYTSALAGLVGDRLQCVVVDDVDRALELLRNLADDGHGRATIFPRAFAPSSPVQTQSPVFDDSAVIGLMIDQIRYAPEDDGIVRALVGDSVLVRSADDARRLRTHDVSCDFVTIDGTVFHQDGRVTGGAGDAFASALLEQKRERRELVDVVKSLDDNVRSLTEDVTTSRERLRKLREALDQAKSQAHEAEIEMVTGEQDLQRLEQRRSLVSNRRGEVDGEASELRGNLDAADEERQTTTGALDDARASQQNTGTQLIDAEREATARREELSHQQATFTDRKVQLASVSERMHSCTSALERLVREHDELAERIAGLEQERDEGAREAGRLAADIIGAREELLEAKGQARLAHTAFENARLGLDDARHSLGLREAELRELRHNLDEASTSLQEQEMLMQRLILEREHLEEGVRERFRGLELRTIVGDHHCRAQVGDEQTTRIKQLTVLIDRMGSVNVDAMKEFEEQSERYEYYSSQYDDLQRALADLEKAIGQMNKESKRLFKYAFDGINRRFKEIFPKMFRGGRAELRLTNPEDMLETGIDILAQPPGKRLGNLELMSGGEKAFTAVSLLLALFRFKPSPFCILDEVDAPLDDANVERYVEAIRAMTDRSQFIVITHSKQTMQAVDVLYGVTMQEPGVSKLVGVRVGDNRSTRSQRRSDSPITTSAGLDSSDAGDGPGTADGAESLEDQPAAVVA
jgi:chromosome segregation protein